MEKRRADLSSGYLDSTALSARIQKSEIVHNNGHVHSLVRQIVMMMHTI